MNKKKKKVEFLERETVVLTEELKKKCEDRVKETIALAKKLWKVQLPMPEIRYDLKSLCGGLAMPGVNRLRFHPIYLVENETDYITETVPHEVAHLIVRHVAPILRKKHPELGDGKVRGHGKEWQMVMQALGRGPREGQTWKDVIKHQYDPSSIQLPARKKLGPRKPGGKAVGDIIAKIKGLKPEELEALKLRLGFEIDPEAEPTEEDLLFHRDMINLVDVLNNFNNVKGKALTPPGRACEVIKHLSK